MSIFSRSTDRTWSLSFGYKSVEVPNDGTSQVKFLIALACGAWYLIVLLCHSLGLFQLFRHYSSKKNPSLSPTLNLQDVPHVTLLRPIKGLEPFLYECLAAGFRQHYPREKFTIYLCVATANDPAVPTLHRLLIDFPNSDARILIESEDDALSKLSRSQNSNLGPNPKIRNLSRGYREAKGDIIWILDCNIWVCPGVMGRMVDKLCGIAVDGSLNVPYKLVHQLPIVIDCLEPKLGHSISNISGATDNSLKISLARNKNQSIHSKLQNYFGFFGGRLEEVFMGSSHAKNYTAINTVSVAPCLVGKSNMFRKTHLDYLTRGKSNMPSGLDFFSRYICEDHIIGDTLWRNQVKEEKSGQKFHKHGLVYGDLAIQPMAQLSILGYLGRRVRWIRARKWAVPMATIVEPGVESLVCSGYGAYAFTSLPWFQGFFGGSKTRPDFLLIWIMCICMHLLIDILCFARLHSLASIEIDANTPQFVHSLVKSQKHRHLPIGQWMFAWIGRELLAFPIWAWACFGGATITWRGKKFLSKPDMSVVELTQIKPKAPIPNTKKYRKRLNHLYSFKNMDNYDRKR
ncbi:Ceramide glucosyltransferase [Erysiphe neolycopersici]|uniref:Ceramide glucosyltransferase n=1 Tax=Erysiphe neolycopersici TaxID=212602 RepID=A0A420I4Q0_9PEZI|nr:Ceramide glucosyltransferase [Erysiphe neolycopersici]